MPGMCAKHRCALNYASLTATITKCETITKRCAKHMDVPLKNNYDNSLPGFARGCPRNLARATRIFLITIGISRFCLKHHGSNYSHPSIHRVTHKFIPVPLDAALRPAAQKKKRQKTKQEPMGPTQNPLPS